MTVDGHTLRFSYDSGKPMFIKYDSTTFQYVLNLQGDVIAIMNSEGAVVVEYAYDAWGNVLSVTGSHAFTLGYYNPLRYRGYVYDYETGLYYLQSRYYSPEWGRFLNADSFVSTGQGLLGSNMFVYCGNNPIAFSDPSGHYYAGTIDNEFTYAFCDKECGGGGTGSLTGVLGAAGTAAVISAPTIGNWLSTYFYNVSSEVRLYAKCLMDQSANKYADHQPRIHHVIPQGDFSHFGDDTVMYINEMHAILNSVGININDPENLVIISQGTHKSMHTKHYFACIYEIMITAEPGNEASVRWALYLARTYASSLDRFPKGY